MTYGKEDTTTYNGPDKISVNFNGKCTEKKLKVMKIHQLNSILKRLDHHVVSK